MTAGGGEGGGPPAGPSAITEADFDDDSPPPPPPPPLPPPAPALSTALTSDEVLRTCVEVLGHNEGKISTTLYTPGEDTRGFSLLPNVRERAMTHVKEETVLSPAELLPQTPVVFCASKEEAFSPQMLEFCLQKPIVLIRNMSNVCGIDLSLYTTKSLAATHPSHPVEIRTQMEQSADENWDPTMSKQVCNNILVHYEFIPQLRIVCRSGGARRRGTTRRSPSTPSINRRVSPRGSR